MATDHGTAQQVTVFVGGVSELFQSDLDLGRLAVERLQGEDLGPGVFVEEVHYGAVAVTQRLQDVRPDTLVLVSAVRRDRPPGTVERRLVDPPKLDLAQFQTAVGDAVTGYVHIDLIIDIATGFDALPGRTVTVEVEPEKTSSGDGLSRSAQAGLEEALDLIRAEVRRAPLLHLADELSVLVGDGRLQPSTSRDSLRRLLGELRQLGRNGRWGRTFALRDRMRLCIAGDPGSEGMESSDWALWWALIEELDRLEAVEADPRASSHTR